MTEASISGLLNQLHISNNKLEALEELKTVVYAASPSDLRRILPNISIANIFNCLNTSNKGEQELCGEILSRMLSSLSSGLVLEYFHSQILSWLRLPDSSVQALCLPLLRRLSEEAAEQLSSHEDLVVAIVSMLEVEALGPSLIPVLTHLGEDPSGLRVLFSEQVVQHLSVVMQKNDTCRFRIYQMATDISMTSPHALDLCVSSGLLNQLIAEVGKDDVLVQLNAVELLSDLARSQHGLHFLSERGIVGQMEQMIVELNSNPMAGLLLPGLIKFFGGLARNHPKEILTKFHHFVDLVLSSASSRGDAAMQGVALDTIAFIGFTPEGKLALEKLGNPMTECVHSVGAAIQSGRTEQRVRALKAMTSLVHLPVSHQTSSLVDLTERWFCSCLPQAFQSVWSIAQQPFSELRCPALALLQSVALCPWGQKLMNSTPGFREFLLDRSTETTKEGKEGKFELVKVLAESPTTGEIFGAPYRVKLIEYFNQGAFYVAVQSEVASERI